MILSEAAVHSCIFRNKHFHKSEHMPYETLEQNPQNDIRDMFDTEHDGENWVPCLCLAKC